MNKKEMPMNFREPGADTLYQTKARQKSNNFKSLRFFTQFLKPYKPQISSSFLAILMASGAVLALGQGLRYLVDAGLSAGSEPFLNHAIFVLLIGVITLAFASFSRFYLVSWISENIASDIRSSTFKHILSFPPSFFETRKVGEILSRLTTDTTLLQTIIGTSIPIALRNILMGIGGLILLVITSFKLTSLVLLIIPLVLFPMIWLGKKVKGHSKQAQGRIGSLNAAAEEIFSSLHTSQSFCHEQTDIKLFEKYSEHFLESAEKRIITRAWMSAIVIAVAFGAISVVLWVGGHGVISGDLTSGELSAFLFYAMLVAGCVGSLSEIVGDIQRASGAAERLNEVLSLVSPITSPAEPLTIPTKSISPLLYLKRLSFAYPAAPEKQILTDFSLRIDPGEMVAFVGRSGVGKSSLFDLLLRFYDPQQGSIEYKGVNIKQANLQDLRSRIGLVPQKPIIFGTSIYQNIAYGNPTADRETILEAAEMAMVTEFSNRLKNGIETYVGEKGQQLSLGQCQRIAIARALVKQPEILLLDEATSALDAVNERYVQQAIEKVMQSRTVLIIAHRLATLLKANRIVVIENGVIESIGTHQELIQKGGFYQRLARLEYAQQVVEVA